MTYIAKNVIKSVGLELPSVKSSFLDLSLFCWYYYTVLISISFSLSYIILSALLMLASFFYTLSLYIISDWIDNNNQTKGRDKEKKRRKVSQFDRLQMALYWCLLLLCSINRASAGAIRTIDPFFVCAAACCCWAPVEFLFHRARWRIVQCCNPSTRTTSNWYITKTLLLLLLVLFLFLQNFYLLHFEIPHQVNSLYNQRAIEGERRLSTR